MSTQRNVILLVLGLVLAGRLAAQDEEKVVYEPGIDIRFYWVGESMSMVPRLVAGQTPNVNWLAPHIDFAGPSDDSQAFAHHFISISTARLEIPADGLYEFRLTSDDGSYLLLDGLKVLDHDGLHGGTTLDAAVELKQGFHKLEVHHFENTGDWQLRLEWRPPTEDKFRLLDDRNLSTPKGLVRVVAPGKKKVLRQFTENLQGDRRPLVDTHPGYDLVTLRPDGFRPKVGGMAFLPDGRLVVCCWEPEGRVFIVDGVHGNQPERVTVKKIAEGLAEPLGLVVVDGRLFVLQKQELTELIDHDGDEVIDEYRCLCDLWHVSANFHEFAFGLVEKDGWLYLNLAIAINPGGRSTNPQVQDRGRSARVNIETGAIEFLCWGLRTPNGICLGPDDEVFITDNQGDWLPSSKLLHLVPGSFFEQRSALPADWVEKPVRQPVVWMPQNEIGNSPGSPALFRTGPYAGQMAVCEVTHGGINRIFVEKVKGDWQGAIFRFCQGFEGGLNRILIGDDGDIFAGGIGSSGNWGQDGKKRYGLQRIRPNGRAVFEMREVSARANGFLVTFSEPVAAPLAPAPGDFELQSFTYEATPEYGGPKRDLRRERVSATHLSVDRRQLFLACEPRPGRIYYLRAAPAFRSPGHRSLWGSEAWYTMNAVPEEAFDLDSAAAGAELPADCRGFVVTGPGTRDLLAGDSTAAFRSYRGEGFPAAGWRVEKGELIHDAGGGGGDLVSRDEYGDFDFECEWKVAEGANSGIMYRVSEDADYPWQTGAEMQILDDQRHADAYDTRHRAGALYGLMPCRTDVVRPAGEWNHARIVARGSQVEHWLNGILVVSYRSDAPWFRGLVANSKFKDMPRFATLGRGRIALQDHGDEVRFRNLRIRALD